MKLYKIDWSWTDFMFLFEASAEGNIQKQQLEQLWKSRLRKLRDKMKYMYYMMYYILYELGMVKQMLLHCIMGKLMFLACMNYR